MLNDAFYLLLGGVFLKHVGRLQVGHFFVSHKALLATARDINHDDSVFLHVSVANRLYQRLHRYGCRRVYVYAFQLLKEFTCLCRRLVGDGYDVAFAVA